MTGGWRLRAYMAVLRVNMKETLAYKSDMVLTLILSVMSSLIYIIVWSAVYSFSNTSSLNGLTLSGMLAYFVVLSAISPILGWPKVVNNMQDDIREGSIARLLIRPMSYVEQLFVEAMPYDLLFFLFASLPIMVLVVLIGGFGLSASTLLLFAAELLIGYLIINLLGFMIGSMAVYLTNIYGIAEGISWVFSIAGGGVVPLLFFPAEVAGALMLTPFPLLFYLPAGTLIGIVTAQQALVGIETGLVWLAILALAARTVWSRVNMAINTVGV